MSGWDPSLETGIAELDDQHRLIFARAGAVLDAAALPDAAEVRRTLDFLLDYAALHFESEEKYMALAGFPDLRAHAAAHADLTARLEDIARAQASGTEPQAVARDVRALIHGWLADHIRRKDRALATFLSLRRG